MTISVACPQGHRLNADDKLAGKKLKCPKCAAPVEVPVPEPEPELTVLDETELASDYQLAPMQSSPLVSPEANPSQDHATPASNAPKQVPPKRAQANDKLKTALIAGIAGGGLIGLLGVVLVLVVVVSRDNEPVVAQEPSTPPVFTEDPVFTNEPEFALDDRHFDDEPEFDEDRDVSKSNDGPTSMRQPANGRAAGQFEPDASGRPIIPKKRNQLPPVLVKKQPQAEAEGPLDLKALNVGDPRLWEYGLPGIAFSTAYDPPTGRLAVCNDEQGLIIYELDSVMEGKAAPVKMFPTQGLPTFVCLKPIGDKRIFCLASNEAQLQTIDAESLEIVSDTKLDIEDFALYLDGSTNAQDPYIYFSTSNRFVGRVDMRDGTQSELSTAKFTDFRVSPDGRRLYLRPPTTGSGFVGSWEDIVSYDQSKQNWQGSRFSRDKRQSLPNVIGNFMSIDSFLFTPSMKVMTSELRYHAHACFQQRPVILGSNSLALVLASANDLQSMVMVPFPKDWMRKDHPYSPKDFRTRYAGVGGFKTRHLDVHVDDQRDLGLVVLDDRMLLVPLSNFGLPAEPDLRPKVQLASQLTPGQDYSVDLVRSTPPAEFQIEFVPSARGVEDRYGLIMRQSDPSQGSGPRLKVSAAMDVEQKEIFVLDLRPLEGESLPMKVVVSGETMIVHEVDRAENKLVVTRTQRTRHSGYSEVQVFSNPPALPATGSLPTVDGATLRWSPALNQTGRHVIRMRSRLGQDVHEWFWEVEVANPRANLPMKVIGIETDPESKLAVVWGQKYLTDLNLREDLLTLDKPNTYYVGVYDTGEQRLLRYQEVDKPIMSAAIDATGIYVCFTTLDVVPKADFKEEQARQQAMYKVMSTQLARLDPDELKVTQAVDVPNHFSRLQLIAGKYLVAASRRPGKHASFNVPDLSPADTPNYAVPIAGRVQSGWVWDGLLYDRKMETPKLMLYPVHFEDSGPRKAETFMPSIGKKIATTTNGQRTSWLSTLQDFPGDRPSRDTPGAVSCINGRLDFYSWAATSRQYVGMAPRPISVELMDPSQFLRLGSNRRYPESSGWVSQSDREIHAVAFGQLVTLPWQAVVQPAESFQFIEEQTEFVLETDRTYSVNYRAPGADHFELHAFYSRAVMDNDKAPIRMSSTNGGFQLKFDDFDRLFGIAKNTAIRGANRLGPEMRSASDTQKILAYQKHITPAFERLAGRPPIGIPVPVYVVVIADREIDDEQACLSHCYLVDVPMRSLIAED